MLMAFTLLESDMGSQGRKDTNLQGVRRRHERANLQAFGALRSEAS